MKVVDKIEINEFGNCKITFIRINPENKSETIQKILEEINNVSWIENKIPEELIPSVKARIKSTVDKLTSDINNNDSGKITSQIGEYFVSEISRETIVNELEYKDIPLAELIKQKTEGNPGFDYHSENKKNIIIFGEAKYVANQNTYGRALKQVVNFITEEKDIKDLYELRDFVSQESILNANSNRKGYAIGFSSYNTKSDILINNIKKNEDFKEIVKYEEIVIIAVDING